MKSFLLYSLRNYWFKKVNIKQPLPSSKLLFLLLTVFFLQAFANAQQYHTYHTADSANPILNATPKPQGIIGMQFFDVDGDKDLDCYMTTSGSDKPLLYKNVGTLKRPEYQLSDSSGFEDLTLVQTKTKQFGFFDMDNDGDMDFFYESYHTGVPATNNYSFIKTYTNDGTPTKPHFVDASTFFQVPYATSLHGYYYFVFQDIDGDGDLDYAFSANNSLNSDFTTQVYLNTSTSGTATFVQQYYGTEQINQYQSFYDFSGDGLPDCLLSNNGVNTGQFFPNIGTSTSPRVDIYGTHGPYQSPNFGPVAPAYVVDLNNDGTVEIFNRVGAYGTVTPVPVLTASTANVSGKPVTKLTATTQLPGYKYQWEYNGKKVTGYNKPFIYAPAKGKYVLYITDTLGTGVSLPYIISPKADSASVNREMIVITKPAVQSLSVTVYPSPFRESATIKITGNSLASKTIRVSDMSGKIWLTQTIAASTIQLGSTLPKGLYQLEVWENNKVAYHTKILKQ